MNQYEMRLRAEWGALRAAEEGFSNTSDALLEIAKLLLPDAKEEPSSLFGVTCIEKKTAIPDRKSEAVLTRQKTG